MAWSEKDLLSILEFNPELRAYFESFASKEEMQTYMTGLQEHENNKNLHVTREEKATWNGFVNNINNITTQIKQEIQNSTSESIGSLQGTLSSHMANNNIHITAEERDKWNMVSSEEGINNIILTKVEGAKTYADNKVNELKSNLQNGTIELPYVNGIRISVGTAQPSDPQDQKDIWINTNTNRIYFFANSRWNGLQ